MVSRMIALFCYYKVSGAPVELRYREFVGVEWRICGDFVDIYPYFLNVVENLWGFCWHLSTFCQQLFYILSTPTKYQHTLHITPTVTCG